MNKTQALITEVNNFLNGNAGSYAKSASYALDVWISYSTPIAIINRSMRCVYIDKKFYSQTTSRQSNMIEKCTKERSAWKAIYIDTEYEHNNDDFITEAKIRMDRMQKLYDEQLKREEYLSLEAINGKD